jgi:CRISPR/Cas system endoribonuclease Cas6 (RAMP superfamily)
MVDSTGVATPLNLARFGSMDDGNHNISIQALQKAYPKPPGLHELTLNFVTPTRLKYGNHLCDAPEFHVLFRNLARRISLLAYFHCGGKWEDSLEDEVKMAESVKTVRNGLEWRDWRRYSNRQEEEMYLGGFVGRLGFRGNLEPFWPYLVLGSYLHIGKGATFGLGRYTFLQESAR